MIGLLVLLLVAVGFVVWDRSSPTSVAPDTRMVRNGTVLTVVGAVTSVFFWWIWIPLVVLVAGASMVVIGRHRVVPTP
jgi:uncharacterized membrane protein